MAIKSVYSVTEPCCILALCIRDIHAQIILYILFPKWAMQIPDANVYEVGHKDINCDYCCCTINGVCMWLCGCSYHTTSIWILDSIILRSRAISNIFSIALLPSCPISKVKLLTYILTNSVIVCFGCPLPYRIA
jgi:hypothetical protein